MNTAPTTEARFTVSREAGTDKPASAVKLGWWIFLDVYDDAPDPALRPAWAEVTTIADTNRGRRIIAFNTRDWSEQEKADGNSITVHKHDVAACLTAREAKKLGLVSS